MESRLECQRNRKIKLQACRLQNPKSLQSQNPHAAQKRISLNGLAIVHGRLTETTQKFVKKHLEYYGSSRFAPQASALLQDSDGQWFLNYLDWVLMAEDEVGPFYDEFMRHKSAVESKLSRYKNNPQIFSKYAWVAGYHNFFCDLHSRHFSLEHKIETELFRATPKLIVDD